MIKKIISSEKVQFRYNTSCSVAVTNIQFSELFTWFFKFAIKASYWILFIFQCLISCSVVFPTISGSSMFHLN